MNRNSVEAEKQNERQPGDEYVVRRSRRADIIAIVVCILLALIVWVVVMNTKDTDYVELEILAPGEYEYVLSENLLEVEGSVSALRRAEPIGVKVARFDEIGEYSLTLDDLMLPEGVTLVDDDIHVTITLEPKR